MKTAKENLKNCYAIKIGYKENDRFIAWVYLYVLKNDLHREPFGLLENVFVEEQYRSKGLGTKLVKRAIAEAKKIGCYKLIATSRTTKTDLHNFYERMSFKKWGLEFRINYTKDPANKC